MYGRPESGMLIGFTTNGNSARTTQRSVSPNECMYAGSLTGNSAITCGLASPGRRR
jgi:hypothetical protein